MEQIGSVRRWVVGARPRTLPAAVVPVALGTAAAVDEGDVVAWRAIAALVVALALQVATNYANDYSDGVRGTDDGRVGPLRLVGSGLASPRSVKTAALVAFGVAGVAGGALALAVGPELFVVGALSMVAGWTYTGGPKPYGYLGLGELFVFVFFGLVATIGSTYVHIESITATSVLCGVAAGCWATALLVTNNLRDRVGDAESGKVTLAVRLGDAATRRLYVALLVAGGLSVVAVALTDRPWAAIGLVGYVAAVEPVRRIRAGALGRDLIPVLERTGQLQLVAGLLTSVGIAIG